MQPNPLLLSPLFKMLNDIKPISSALETALIKSFKLKQIKKGAMMLKEGNVCENLWFLADGLLRSFHTMANKQAIPQKQVASFLNMNPKPSAEPAESLVKNKIKFVLFIDLCQQGLVICAPIFGMTNILSSKTKIYAMRKIIIPVLYLCFLWLFNSCKVPRYVYTPATANLLQVEQKHSLKAAANFSQTNDLLTFSSQIKKSSGLDFQMVYALTNKIAIKADGYYKWESNESFISQNNGPYDKINYTKKGLEISGGIYNFSENKTHSAFQLYAGAGTGKFSFKETDNNNGTNNYYHYMNYLKLFIQPSFSLRVSGNYSISLASRIFALKYYHIQTDYPDLANEPLGFIDKKPSLFADFIFQNEFGFTGLKGIRLQMQTGYTNLFTKFSSDYPYHFSKEKYEYDRFWFSIGVIADIQKLFAQR